MGAYQERFEDELGVRFELFDLAAPAFVKLCLNRVRILGRGYADDPQRPVASASGWIDNPLAPAALHAETSLRDDLHAATPVPLLAELTAYAEHEPALDRRLWARPLVPEHDTDLLWAWMQRPHVAEFWAMAWPRDWIGDYLRGRSRTPAEPLPGLCRRPPDRLPGGLRPARDVLARTRRCCPATSARTC